MSEEQQDATSGEEQDQQQDATSGEEQDQQQAFTQDDVDRIVADRLRREREATRAKYADYDDLKAKAGSVEAVEERLAAMESRASLAEANALRANIANKHGISAEDRDLFLTGSDKDTLTAQAERLAARISEQAKQGNYVPNEGKNPTPPTDDGRRAFVRSLTGRA